MVTNLSAALRDAFSVPEIPGLDATAVVPAVHDVFVRGGEGSSDSQQPKATPASREDLAIEHWLNGHALDQTVVHQLRPLIFAAVSDAFEWDLLGLARSAFVGQTGRAFQRNSISFERQITQVQQHLPVKIMIPEGLSLAAAGTALQGLLRASKNQFQWTFPDGDRIAIRN